MKRGGRLTNRSKGARPDKAQVIKDVMHTATVVTMWTAIDETPSSDDDCDSDNYD